MEASRVVSLFFMIFSGIVVYFSRKLALGTLTFFGPGFIPFWSGVLMFGLSAAIFLAEGKAVRHGKPRTIAQLWAGVSWSKPLILVVVLGLYAVTFTQIGFLASTAVFLAILLRTIEPLRWWIVVVIAIVTTLVVFAVFDIWLKVQLPHTFIEMYAYKVGKIAF